MPTCPARPTRVAADDGTIPLQPPLAPQSSPVGAAPRYRIQVTVDQAYLELLEEARELLQHSVPGRNVIEVQRRALQALVKKLRARKFAVTERPVASRPSASPDALSHKPVHEDATEVTAPARRRHTPAAVRRAVWQRDTARCTYLDVQRCRERGGREFHHLDPHARGGPASIDNLTLRCRAHNALAAEHDFGRAWMAQRKSRPRQRGDGDRPARLHDKRLEDMATRDCMQYSRSMTVRATDVFTPGSYPERTHVERAEEPNDIWIGRSTGWAHPTLSRGRRTPHRA